MPSKLKQIATKCKNNWSLVATVVAVVVGITLGLLLRLADLEANTIDWIRIWGELFIRMFKAVTLPIIVSAVIVGVTGMEGHKSGALGFITILFMLVSYFVSITIAVVMNKIIRPGRRMDEGDETASKPNVVQSYNDLWFDILRNMFPDNLVGACMETVYTVVIKTEVETNSTSSNQTEIVYSEKKELHRRPGINLLGIIFMALVFGIAIQVKKEKAKPLKDFFKALADAVFGVVDIIMWYSSIGVSCLIAGALLVEEDLVGVLRVLALFVAAVMTSHAIHAFVFLPVCYVIIVRRNPLRLFANILDALAAGIAPPSNLLTMAVILENPEKRLHTKASVVNFVLPMLVVFVKNGSAIYISSSILFISITQGAPMDFGNTVMMGCMVSILTAAVPNIPSGSIFIVIVICEALNIPVQNQLGHLFAVDWFLDRLRTPDNGCTVSFGVPIIDRLARLFTSRIKGESKEGDLESDTPPNGEIVKPLIKCDESATSGDSLLPETHL